MSRHGGLTSDHDCADVCSAEVFQHCCGFCFQLVLHDDQTQKLHVGLNVVPSFKKRMKAKIFNQMFHNNRRPVFSFSRFCPGSSTLPVDILHFVPREFRFQSAVSESNDSEALLGVAFQNVSKIFWHLKKQRQKKTEVMHNIISAEKAEVTICRARFLSPKCMKCMTRPSYPFPSCTD